MVDGFKKPMVLLVEDNHYITDLVKLLLGNEGFTVECHKNGEEALNSLEKHSEKKYDIIITDYQMLVVNGKDLSIKLKEGIIYKETPMILITQLDQIYRDANSHSDFFDVILDKSKIYDKLIKEINTFLARKNGV